MRQSSSPSEAGLFDAIGAHGAVRDEVSDSAWLAALLEVETALAYAHAAAGTIPSEHAEAIEAACDPARLDVAEIGRAAASAGNPVLPLLEALRAALPGDMAVSVHFGATTQDVLDTAGMLVAHRALAVVLGDLAEAREAAARLAREHADTPMAGRTLLQRAEPVTFGFVADVWRECLREAADRLAHVRDERLALQFGGAVGTQPAVPGLAARLGLAEPAM
uniref:lyase family protein n=1 Tax=Allorhizocola rhizosphaerae TaxID=1872709 RepID=UPI001FE7EA78